MDSSLFVVGLGASAGGIRAVNEFLGAVPVETGMAFVVILHLSPEHESRLAEVLQMSTQLPVTQVTEAVAVAPNHVYVVPPNRSLSMADGHLVLSEISRIEERRAPIDVFFRTLGESHQTRAVGVVLSGTGADGSMGLKRIKENGGLCFAQDPDDAEYRDMPRNSIATGIVDYVLPAREIPARILTFAQHVGLHPDVPRSTESLATVDEQALRDILEQLRARTGHDFGNYKRPTILRRIGRRMAVAGVSELSQYAQLVHGSEDELQKLLKDLLISVTHFFRDGDAFQTLQTRVIPELFERRGEDAQVRVWVPGCATGEEAYSIAMLLSEYAGSLTGAPAIQIFATDIDAASLATARQGIYSLNDAADVSPERLRRFFVKDADAYRVRQELRELILFSQHNVIRDPPFSHLDLVSCRNVLIYLNRTAQRRVMEVVHFALAPGRFLFLGSSESVEVANDLFASVEKDAYLFQRREVPGKIGLPVSRTRGSLTFDQLPVLHPAPLAPRERLSADLHHHLLELYAPPSVVVNADHEILHLSATAGRYLQFAGGDPSHNLLKVVRSELRLDLRSALFEAAQQRIPIDLQTVPVWMHDRAVPVTVSVKPVLRPYHDAVEAFLVFFREGVLPATDEAHPARVTADVAAQRLDDDVGRLKTQLQTAFQQHDVQAEEYKASLEEQQAMYEELRASSEELETSREELQSLNEELRTVNQELRIKVEEQAHANDDMHNLMSSTEIGTVFLDRTLRIKLFTPSIRSVFKLIPGDRGRPLSDINTVLVEGAEPVQRDVERVISTLERVEREVETRDGRWLLLRAHPYRTSDDRIDGVVVTFLDTTDRKRAADVMQQSEARLQRATQVDNVAIVFFTTDGRITHANEAFLRLAGATRDQLAQGALRRSTATPQEWMPVLEQALTDLRLNGRTAPYERQYVQIDGTRRWVLCAATSVGPDEAVEFMVDVTATKHAEEQLQASEARLRLMIESVTEYAILTMDPQGRIDHWNSGAARLFGYTDAEILGQSSAVMFTPEDRAAGVDHEELRQARETGKASDERWHVRKDGSRFFSGGITAPIFDSRGTLRGYVKVARDLTDRKRLDDALREAHDALELRVRERTGEISAAKRRLEQELEQRKAAEERIRELLGRTISVQEDERRRISRDLHDQVGQQIVALKLTLEALDDFTDPTSQLHTTLRARIEAARQLTAAIDRDIDYFAWQLRPLRFEQIGLVGALRNFVAEWAKTFAVSAEFHSRGLDDLLLPAIVDTNLYRIAQEALNNVHKHAQATVVSVLLERRGKHVVLAIDDDGKGFDQTLQAGQGMGLVGIRERATLLGGLLQIKSTPGHGTRLVVRVPIVEAEERIV